MKRLLLDVHVREFAFCLAVHFVPQFELLGQGLLFLAHLILIQLHLADLSPYIDIFLIVPLFFSPNFTIFFRYLILDFINLDLHIFQLFLNFLCLLRVVADLGRVLLK